MFVFPCQVVYLLRYNLSENISYWTTLIQPCSSSVFNHHTRPEGGVRPNPTNPPGSAAVITELSYTLKSVPLKSSLWIISMFAQSDIYIVGNWHAEAVKEFEKDADMASGKVQRKTADVICGCCSRMRIRRCGCTANECLFTFCLLLIITYCSVQNVCWPWSWNEII